MPELNAVTKLCQRIKSLGDVNFATIFQCIRKSGSDPLYHWTRLSIPPEVRKIFLNYAVERKLELLPSHVDIIDVDSSLETSLKLEIVGGTQKMLSRENLEMSPHFVSTFMRLERRRAQTLNPNEFDTNRRNSNWRQFKFGSKQSAAYTQGSPSGCAATRSRYSPPSTDALFAALSEHVDATGRVDVTAIARYLHLKTTLMRFQIALSAYDSSSGGYVCRQQLKEFLDNEIFSSVVSIRDLEETLRDYYTSTVLSMFFFFLDANHSGRCRVTDVVVSGFLENICALADDDDGLGTSENWFSPEKTKELLCHFRMLDVDGVGHLTPTNFSRLADGAYTPAFVERLFEIHVKDGGLRMSFDEFIVFQIATDHLAHPSAIRYFFKILDLNEDGYLTGFEVRHFYASLRQAYCDFMSDDEAMPDLGDFTDSIFDFALPAERNRISAEDLMQCKRGHEFIMSLINHVEFAQFENRDGDCDANGDEIGDGTLNSEMAYLPLDGFDMGLDDDEEPEATQHLDTSIHCQSRNETLLMDGDELRKSFVEPLDVIQEEEAESPPTGPDLSVTKCPFRNAASPKNFVT